MLKLQFNRKGGACPKFFCDACGKPIRAYGQGLAQLFEDGRIRIVHHNHAVRGCDDGGGDAGWMELSHFMVHLEANMGLSREAHAMAWDDTLLFASL